MNVKKLIKLLQKEDPEMRVVVQGYESGFDEVDSIHKTYITKQNKKEDKWWDGEFREATVDNNDETVILLPRKS
jgi:hypothetical protein